MSGMTIDLAVTDEASIEVHDAIEHAINVYNDARMGVPGNGRALVIPIRETASGPVTGGLWGYSWAEWVYIELLVVPAHLRHTGLGTRMMRLAEEEAARRGCVGIWLATHTFQARPFYERLGYTVFATLPDFPRGHTRFFMMKRLPATL